MLLCCLKTLQGTKRGRNSLTRIWNVWNAAKQWQKGIYIIKLGKIHCNPREFGPKTTPKSQSLNSRKVKYWSALFDIVWWDVQSTSYPKTYSSFYGGFQTTHTPLCWYNCKNVWGDSTSAICALLSGPYLVVHRMLSWCLNQLKPNLTCLVYARNLLGDFQHWYTPTLLFDIMMGVLLGCEGPWIWCCTGWNLLQC